MFIKLLNERYAKNLSRIHRNLNIPVQNDFLKIYGTTNQILCFNFYFESAIQGYTPVDTAMEQS